MAHTAKHNATIAKKKAQNKIDTYKAKGLKNLNKQQKAKLKAAQQTKKNATVVINTAAKTEGKSHDSLQQSRNVQMNARARAQQDLENALKAGSGKTKAQIADLRSKVFTTSLRAQSYGDAMRAITGRQMGQGTAYTGPGATIALDAQGRPKLTTTDIGGTPAGSVIYDIDPAAYIKRFRPKFQPTQEQIDRAGGPGGWVGGLLQGTEAGYLTPWQQTNFQWMLEDADRGILGDAGDFARLPKDWRSDWRREEWGDTFNEATGRWERATDPTVRQAAVEDQLRRYNEGLFNPYTGQGVGGTGPPPWPGQDVTFPWNQTTAGDATTTTGGGREYLTTPYTRPALQDWSHLMPEEGLLRSQTQRAIVADQGANFQPWAQGGLIEYSPAGTATYVPRTYTPSGSTGTTGTTSAETATTTTVPQVYTLRDGTKTTDFMKFTQDNAERYYPGRFQAAQDAGVSGWRAFTPEGREWTAAQPNTSAAWIAAQRAANDAGTRQVASNAVFNAGRGLLNPTPAGTDLATLIALEGR